MIKEIKNINDNIETFVVTIKEKWWQKNKIYGIFYFASRKNQLEKLSRLNTFGIKIKEYIVQDILILILIKKNKANTDLFLKRIYTK